MDVDELIERAWKAVEKADVPEGVQPVAFKEAVDFLRGEPEQPDRKKGKAGSGERRTERRRPSGSSSKDEGGGETPNEETFFSRLAEESGVSDSDLRDVLQLHTDGKVLVGPPTRSLGSTVADQAKTVITLVAGAHGMGLGENPVQAEPVRAEMQRKRCYNVNNFSSKHLGPLKGFNAGANRTEIRMTSRAPDEFRDAVARAQGKGEPDEG